jgi:arginine decarboxylase
VDRLFDQLNQYSNEGFYPMHMPGHKRNTKMLSMGNPYAIDITEIDGFDNLHQAEGILELLSKRISKLYNAGKSYPLVNGSTAGILAGIAAATNKGDKILMARNCHKSVYHAAILRELEPVYIYPQQAGDLPVNGGILPSKIEQLLITQKDIRLVVITSPTYEGVVSDIAEIAKIVHQNGALLLVDEAHGAHFGFHEGFPRSAVTQGADFVIQSLHKTLPAFTQTAVLHLNRTELSPKVEQYLAFFESSSPSYLLLSGIDRCISLLEDHSEMLFHNYYERLESFYQSLRSLKRLFLLDRGIVGRNGVFDLDSSKLTIFTGDLDYNGHQLGKILREKYKIIMEMEARDYVLGMTSICDTKEGFERLKDAVWQIDQDRGVFDKKNSMDHFCQLNPEKAFASWKAMELKSELIKLENSSLTISKAFISLFPPGSPLIVPGEIISEEILDYIRQVQKEGLTITGLHGIHKDEIEVIAE